MEEIFTKYQKIYRIWNKQTKNIKVREVWVWFNSGLWWSLQDLGFFAKHIYKHSKYICDKDERETWKYLCING